MAQQPFDLYALEPAAKRAMEAEDRFKADLKTKNKFRARPKTGSTARSAAPPARNMQTQGDGSSLTAGYDPVTDRFFRALGNTLGNQNVTENLRFIDKNLLNMSNAENAAFNFGRGEGTLSDAIDIALAAPMAGVVAKPLGVVGRGLRTAARMTPGAERVANLAARVAQSRPVQYMAEARPVLDNADDAIETAFTVTPGVQRRITNQRPVVQGLPAPEQRLGLPAPGPKLPSFAAKPKGGQWYADKHIGAVRPSDLGIKVARVPEGDQWFVRDGEGRLRLFDTEDEARDMAQKSVDNYRRNASVERAVRLIAGDNLGLAPDADGPLSQLQDWFLRAAPRYIKNEMGTAEDPMRALAERGALHVALSPDEWSQAAGDVIKSDTIGDVLGLNQLYPKEGAMPGAGDDFRASVVTNMPWLTKAPVTDKVYGIGDTRTLQDKMGLGHILDEMSNAVSERSGLPSDLAVRPESLARMSLPQAAERVALINQWRAKEMERAALDAQNNPVTHVFKEYAENNPKGLRWVEMAPPKGDAPTNYDVAEELQKALKYEGDTMGHCVGGYCPDVMSGRSRIFSLRDAKGEPHVTIETAPIDEHDAFSVAADSDPLLADTWNEYYYGGNPKSGTFSEFLAEDRPDVYDKYKHLIGGQEDIIQIKGKQNRKPKDEYLPFVQDFVKSGQWGGVGDLENTGLVRLPDGRYITAQQWQEGINAVESPWRDPTQYDERYLDRLSKAEWEHMAPYFKGYARGGRAFAAKPCSCDHSLAVR